MGCTTEYQRGVAGRSCGCASVVSTAPDRVVSPDSGSRHNRRRDLAVPPSARTARRHVNRSIASSPAVDGLPPHWNLVAWQRSYDLGLEVLRFARALPHSERFVLGDHLSRTAISVASNIAEGRSRYSPQDFVRFLRYSLGSLAELDTQLQFAFDLGLLAPGHHGLLQHTIADCTTLVQGLIRATNRSLGQLARTPRRRVPSSTTPPRAPATE